MKIKWLNILTLVLVGTFLVGCTEKSAPTSSEQQAEIIKDKFIVRNSHSEYSIVIPRNYKNKERIAADTLATYINKSSGAKMNIITDNELVSGTRFISLGSTKQFEENFQDVSMEKLDGKISSYFISTKNDDIYIYSNPLERGEAITYGVFDLLHDLVDYEYYASDEIYYTEQENINLRDYKNFFIEPSFDGRAIANRHLMLNQDVCDNHRIINQYRGSEWASELYGHGQVRVFANPGEKYDATRTVHEAHPEWFSNRAAATYNTTNNQLCWSAGEELERWVADKFIYYFEKYPDATYFMCGQEDNATSFCRCEKCMHAMEEYACNYAGLQIIFMNHVIEMTEAWLKENQPGRQVRYVVFAYYATKIAPVEQKNGEWVLLNDRVKPHEKLNVFYAPITCNFAFPFDNNYFNSESFLELKQWNQVARGQFLVYLYDVNFKYYFANFGNFGTFKSMGQVCKELGVSYFYTQGAMDSETSALSLMREYVESKLLWNLNLDYEELARDFCEHYYREAAPEMFEYYQTIRDRLAEYHTERGDGGSIYNNIANKNIYPYSVLRYYKSLFDKSLQKISHYQQDDEAFYVTLKGRLMREYLSVIYLMMTLAKSEVSDEDKAEMKEIFSLYSGVFGITKANENGTIIDIDGLFA